MSWNLCSEGQIAQWVCATQGCKTKQYKICEKCSSTKGCRASHLGCVFQSQKLTDNLLGVFNGLIQFERDLRNVRDTVTKMHEQLSTTITNNLFAGLTQSNQANHKTGDYFFGLTKAFLNSNIKTLCDKIKQWSDIVNKAVRNMDNQVWSGNGRLKDVYSALQHLEDFQPVKTPSSVRRIAMQYQQKLSEDGKSFSFSYGVGTCICVEAIPEMRLRNLRYLQLTWSSLHNINFLEHSDIPLIQSISLENNRIRSVGVFRRLAYRWLRNLRLSHNQITDFFPLLQGYFPSLAFDNLQMQENLGSYQREKIKVLWKNSYGAK